MLAKIFANENIREFENIFCKREYPRMSANFRKKIFMGIHGHSRVFALKKYFWAFTVILGYFR